MYVTDSVNYWAGPLACLSLPSIKSWIRSDTPIWKLALVQSCSLRIKRSRQRDILEWMFPLWTCYWGQFSLLLQYEILEKLMTYIRKKSYLLKLRCIHDTKCCIIFSFTLFSVGTILHKLRCIHDTECCIIFSFTLFSVVTIWIITWQFGN